MLHRLSRYRRSWFLKGTFQSCRLQNTNFQQQVSEKPSLVQQV